MRAGVIKMSQLHIFQVQQFHPYAVLFILLKQKFCTSANKTNMSFLFCVAVALVESSAQLFRLDSFGFEVAVAAAESRCKFSSVRTLGNEVLKCFECNVFFFFEQ